MKLFDKNIFLDAFNRLKVLGLIGTMIFVIEAICIAINKYVFYTQQIKDIMNGGISQYREMNLGFSDVHPIILLIPAIVVPILMLVSFGFLNKRNSCDFFHCVPAKRQTVYGSIFAAVMAWAVIILIVSSAAAFVLSAIFKNVYTLNIQSMTFGIISVLVASFLVAASIGIAMSITGTYFNNIIVSLIIIFMPRVLISFVYYLSMADISIIELNFENAFFLGLQNNLIFGTALYAIGRGGAAFYNIASIIYTLVLAIIYFAAGTFLFTKRKSEIAGLAASSRKLQALFRIVVSLLICLIPLYFVFSAISGNASMSPSDFYYIVVFYIIALIVYFVYELVATRKLKNVLKAIPGIFILIACNIVIVLLMLGVNNAVLSFAPAAEEIQYVRMVGGTTGDNSYFKKVVSEIKIKDAEVNKLIADRLKEEVQLEKDHEPYKLLSSPIDYSYYSIEIASTEGKAVRRIALSYDEMLVLLNALTSNGSEFENINILPDPANTKMYFSANYMSKFYENENNEQTSLVDVYNAYRAHAAQMDPVTFYNDCIANPKYGYFTELYVEVVDGANSYNMRLPITKEFKDALEIYLAYQFEENAGTLDSFVDTLNRTLNNEPALKYGDVNVYTLDIDGNDNYFNLDYWFNLEYTEDGYVINNEYDQQVIDNGKLVTEALKNNLQRAPQVSDLNLVRVSIYYEASEVEFDKGNAKGIDANDFSIILNLSQADYDTLKELSESYNY